MKPAPVTTIERGNVQAGARLTSGALLLGTGHPSGMAVRMELPQGSIVEEGMLKALPAPEDGMFCLVRDAKVPGTALVIAQAADDGGFGDALVFLRAGETLEYLTRDGTTHELTARMEE